MKFKDRVEKGIKVNNRSNIRQQFKCARALEGIIGKDRLNSPGDLPLTTPI